MATYAIDTARTLTTALLMSSGPRFKFGGPGEARSTEQDVTKAGEKKWGAEIAVTFAAEPGQRPESSVISVGLVGGDRDPAQGIAPGTPVELVGFRVGISAPEINSENGRLRGGRPWFQADGIKPARAVADHKAA